MVVAYASIHFGKPLGETIPSVFGGYLLGVLALYTRSIWGGLLFISASPGSWTERLFYSNNSDDQSLRYPLPEQLLN